MPTRFFAPLGPESVQIGGMVDDDGQRFMVIRYTDETDDTVVVSMPIPLFQAFARLAANAAEASATRAFWKSVPRG